MNLVCLVSRQAMPNVLPALMYHPANLFLLSTQEEIECAKHLQSFFMKRGVKVFLYADIKAYEDIDLKKRLSQIFNDFENDISLNVTGGTKLMALAAYEYFRNKNRPAFYCNTEDKQIIHLLPARRTENLDADLCIEDYLSVYGYKIEEEKPVVTDFNYEEFFSIIEKNNHLSEFIKFADAVRKTLEDSNKTINSKAGNFSYQKTPAKFILSYNKLKTPIKHKFDTKDFLFGDWLEYYVYWKCKLLNPDEIKIGVKIISDNSNRNEIDIIVLKNYKLFLISCKSGRIENSALYELEALRAITSGTFGKGAVVVSNKAPDNIINRTKELSITLISDLNKIILPYK